jgi:hypothetical protein
MKMNMRNVVATLLAVGLMSGAAWAQANVDLNTWSQKGPSSNGNWTVENGGDSVFQSINGNPTYFVSPNDFFNTTINGSFLRDRNRQSGINDDDYIGFVFGYNEPGANSTDATFHLLDWKRGNQSSSEAGFRLSLVNGTNTPPFGNAENDNLPNYDVLAINTTTSNPGNIAGWENNVVYDFSLLYTPNRIKVDIEGGTNTFQNGVTVFDVAPADVGLTQFQTGQFGFYNYSQQGVEYRSFTLTEPSLSTTPGDTGTLSFLARVGESDSQTVAVSNAGGAGTLLTGAVSSPAGAPFSGPTEPTAFSLGSAASDTFTFTYDAIARTAGTPETDSVVVSSNEDGSHTIDLSGVAVGPVASFSSTPGSTIDLGLIDYQDTNTVALNLANITPDNDGGNSDLTDLTVNSLSITGPDADKFSIAAFTPGTVVGKGDNIDLQITFDPSEALGLFDATLTLFTDEGTALAGDGSDFSFSLTGESIPEPASVMLLGLGGLLLAARRR